MNSYTVKILVFFLSIFMLITITSQLYLAFQNKYETETAVAYSAQDKTSFRGIYVRNEKVINNNFDGVISYPNPDGSKIAKNSVIAYVYDNPSNIQVNQELKKLNSELSMLKKVQNPGTTKVAQPEFLSKLIDEKYQSITNCIENNDMTKLLTEKEELLTLMNIMQIVIGKESNYNERQSYLEAQILEIESLKTEPIETILGDEPGYFVSYVDGYEDKLTYENIDTLTVEEIKKISNSSVNPKKSSIAVGKIIDDYQWKMVGIIDNSEKMFLQGAKVQLKMSYSSEPVNAAIEEITETSNPEESIVILSCDKLTFNLVQHRVERVEMVLGSYDGIRVPRKAIRFYNGQKGVYVKLGESLLFKKLDVIFEGEDYVISSKTPKDGYVLLYDDIVIEGVNLAEEINQGKLETVPKVIESSDTNKVSETTSATSSKVTQPSKNIPDNTSLAAQTATP